MKNIILTLMAASLAGLLVSASAQPVPADDNTVTPPAAPPGAPPAMAPDAGAPPPPDATMDPGAAAAAAAAAAADDTGGDAAAPAATTTTPAQPSQPFVINPSTRGGSAMPNTTPYETQSRSQFMPPDQAVGTNVNDLTLNFSYAPLSQVLNYLSDAAGFIIVTAGRIPPSATVTVKGNHLTQQEAVDLLNSVLNRNEMAAIRDGRTLTIEPKYDAMSGPIPVVQGNIPADIPNTAEMVTQIIPIRFVEARQLASDLSSFVSSQARVVANEAGNAIVITDTRANIKHLVQIIRAVDDSAEAETVVRVFPLLHASPSDVATEIGNIFPSSSSGGGAQSPIRFNGGGGRGGGGGGLAALFGGGGGGGGGGGSADRIRKATAVNAVPDPRIQAVIVTAPKDMIEEIAQLVTSLDVESDRDQKVYMFTLNNADPQAVAAELQAMFQTSGSRSSSGSSTSSALTTRANQNMNSTTTSGMGTIGGGSGLGGGGGGGGGRGGF